MASTKAILAASSVGLGAALVFMVTTIQRDRFAFTRHDLRNSDALTAVTIVAPAAPSHVVEPASVTEEMETIRIETLEVKPAVRPLPRMHPSAPREPVKTIAPPCRPTWRELESGPAGKSVRDICPPAADVPRS
jgi:hypothetical protein